MLLERCSEGKGLVMHRLWNVQWHSVLPTVTLGCTQRYPYGDHLAEWKRLGTFNKLTCTGYLKLSMHR